MGLLAGTIFDRPPHCERCERLESECVCPPLELEPRELVRLGRSGRGPVVRVGVEKRKHGRMMTVVRDLDPEQVDVSGLLKLLKNACGAGGTISEGLVEIQGSHGERVKGALEGVGIRVRG